MIEKMVLSLKCICQGPKIQWNHSLGDLPSKFEPTAGANQWTEKEKVISLIIPTIKDLLQSYCKKMTLQSEHIW